MAAAAQVTPPPKATRSSWSPGANLASWAASSRASGMEAAEVLATWSTLMMARSAGMPIDCAVAVRILRLAWCATSQSTSSTDQPCWRSTGRRRRSSG